MGKFEKHHHNIVSFLASILCFFHLYTGLFGLMPSPQQRSLHLGLTLIIVFLTVPIIKNKQKSISLFTFSFWLDLFFIISAFIATSYVFFNYGRFIPSMMSQPTIFEKSIAIIFIIVVLETGRRTIGLVFPSLTFLIMIYTLFGQNIPGKFGHPGFSLTLIIKELFFSLSGVFGFLTGLSSTYIALFVIFGAFLLAVGGGKTFIDIAILIAGRFKGGQAKIAVVASGFFAMLSGSPMANAATTGNFTIPMMKEAGYSSEFAAGVEAAASSGGILTPPIMGAAAFLMAEILGIPYLQICLAAMIPSLLFFLTVFMGVHLQAVKRNIPPVNKEELPKREDVFVYSKLSTLFIPIFVLLFTLIKGRSLTFVGSSACSALLICYIFSSFSLKEIELRIKEIPSILQKGGESLIAIVPILACANIILHLLDYTGLSIKFSSMVMSVGQSSYFLSLLLTGILVMILGTGLPTTGAYIVGVVVAAPMLESWGAPPIAGHLFILYYSTLATITPPVCPTAYVTAAIAQADWFKTALNAMKLAPLLYLMPFLFMYDGSLLLIGDFEDILLNLSTAIIGAIVLPSGTIGQLIIKSSFLESIFLILSGLLFLMPNFNTDIFGLVLLCIVIFNQILRMRRKKTISKGNINY